MIIKDFKALATTQKRKDALEIAEAGYEAIEIKKLFSGFVMQHSALSVQNDTYEFSSFSKIYVVGIGKGSALAIKSLISQIPDGVITEGIVIDIHSTQLPKNIQSFIGTHPLPSEKNVDATTKLVAMLKKTTENDLVICVICGGGSSLLCQPAGKLKCVDLQTIYDYLLKSGANIEQMNIVRKHLSLVHGGYLASYAYPATVVSLIVSDVVGDSISTIASGPTCLDNSTKEDAQEVAAEYGLQNVDFNETPKEKRFFHTVHNYIVASGKLAVEAMAAKATELGYHAKIYSERLDGFAKEVGPELAEYVRSEQALLACGETQVKVTHPGKGGRNQDVALSALPFLSEQAVIISAASDGKDNINVAGGITDGTHAAQQAKQLGIDPTEAVENNRSYDTLNKLNGIFKIHAGTANISDFIVVLN